MYSELQYKERKVYNSKTDAVCARGQLPEYPAIQCHEVTGIFELGLLEQHPKRERYSHLMLAEFGIWTIAVDVGHHAITETEIDTIPFGSFHIGAAYTILNAEVTDMTFRAIIYSPFCNGRGNVITIFDVVGVDGV